LALRPEHFIHIGIFQAREVPTPRWARIAGNTVIRRRWV